MRATAARDSGKARRRAFWSRQLRQWHWVSSAICLVGMLGFAVTGVTLNHASAIGSAPVTSRMETTLPAPLVARLAAPAVATAPVPAEAADLLERAWSIDISTRPAEWSDDEIYVPLPRPGGDAFVIIDRATGVAEYERTDRGWIAYLNDLHKGRNTGRLWAWFLDVFAGACVVFALTGLYLLYIHSPQRPATWPLVGLGLLVPMVLGLLMTH